mmetsp:Transcript_15115/g.36702  ORF Transcript_15115/g.36702 Transcript_15115/m.36702 type:complete len:314 (+) Transcript_15115:57-998(+)
MARGFCLVTLLVSLLLSVDCATSGSRPLPPSSEGLGPPSMALQRAARQEGGGQLAGAGSDREGRGAGDMWLFSCFGGRPQKKLNSELWEAAKKGDTGMCKTLVEGGADLESQSIDASSDASMVFKHLYGMDHIEEREKALASGIDPNDSKNSVHATSMREDSGRTALRWAAWAGHVDTVKELLCLGADVNAADPDGWSALHEAAVYGHTDVVEALLEAGADVDQETGQGWKAIHLAGSHGHMAITTMLHAHGCDMCHTTDGELTAMDWAKAYGWTDVAAFLRDAPGKRSGGCMTCGRSNFFVQGGLQSVISTM